MYDMYGYVSIVGPTWNGAPSMTPMTRPQRQVLVDGATWRRGLWESMESTLLGCASHLLSGNSWNIPSICQLCLYT